MNSLQLEILLSQAAVLLVFWFALRARVDAPDLPVRASGFRFRWRVDHRMGIPILALLALCGLGLLLAPRTQLVWVRAFLLLDGVVLFYVLQGVLNWRGDPFRAAVGMVIAAVVIAFLALLGTNWEAGAMVKVYPLAKRLPALLPPPVGGMGPRLTAGLMAVMVMIPLGLLLFGKGGRVRLLGGLAALVGLIPLVLSQSPQGYLGLAVGLLVMAAVRSPWMLFPGAGLVGLAAWGWVARHAWLPEALVANLEVGIEERLNILPYALRVAQDYGFTGTGPNGYASVLPLYHVSEQFPIQPRNVLLGWLTDFGALGTVSLGALVLFGSLWGLRALRAEIPTNDRAAVVGALGGLGAYFGFGLGEHLYFPGVWLLLAMLSGAGRVYAGELPALLGTKGRRAVLALLALEAVIWSPVWAGSLAVNAGRVLYHRAALGMESPDGRGYEAAGQLGRLAVGLNSGNPRGHVLEGLAEVAVEDWTSAVESLENAYHLDKSDPRAAYELAESLYEQGQPERAVYYWRAVGAGNNLLKRGGAAREAGDLEGAIHWYRLAVEAAPDDYRGWVRLGSAQEKAGALDPAERTLLEALDRFPREGWVYHTLAGFYLWRAQNPERAIKVAERGIAQAEDPPAGLYYQASRAAGAAGDSERALAYAIQAVKLRPQDPASLAWLGDLYLSQDDAAGALRLYSRAKEAGGERWAWLGARHEGKAYTALENWAGAVEAYREAVEKSLAVGADPGDISRNYRLLGEALSAAGDEAGAALAFKKADTFSPPD